METILSIEELLSTPENQICADCNENQAKFANIPNAVFICENCKLWHENYNKHITSIKDLSEKFSVYELKLLSIGGNSSFNNFSLSYGLEIMVPLSSRYDTYASECYRSMLKVTASGGNFEESWPNLENGRLSLEGMVKIEGTFSKFSSNTVSLYHSACRKGEDVVKAISGKMLNYPTVMSVGNTMENIVGELEGLTQQGYQKISGCFSRD